MRYDPFDPEIIHGDPHPIHRWLRDAAPAYYVQGDAKLPIRVR